MEPDSRFLCYIAPAIGTSKCIEQAITDFFIETEISLESLIAMGCDRTNVNISKHEGIIRLLEKRLDKPLQWIVCLLHINELPFRSDACLNTLMVGRTSGPRTLSGTIGKDLETCEKRTVARFKPILAEMPEFISQYNRPNIFV